MYSNIPAALGKNGVVSESQNMTAMAQQSTKIANDQVYTVVYVESHSAFWIKMVQNWICLNLNGEFSDSVMTRPNFAASSTGKYTYI